MPRRPRGRPVHGWLIVDKPAGLTSAAVVAKAKWALDAAKAGHAGTLDPAATGLLALAFGEATKTVPFVADAAQGLPLHRALGRRDRRPTTPRARSSPPRDARPDAAAIRAALPAFTGDILQVPPQVSAVKVEGERAYARARAGETLDLAARPLHVERLELVGDARPRHRRPRDGLRQGRLCAQPRPRPRASGSAASATSRRCAGSGPGRSRSTRRSTGRRCSAEARTPALDARLLPVPAAPRRAAGARLPRTTPPAGSRNGNAVPLPAPAGLAEGAAVWASRDGLPLAVGAWRAGALHPSRVFVLD